MTRAMLAALFLVLAAAPAARAQSDEEELQLLFGNQKVSAATKSSQAEDASDAAAQVTVITGDEIRAFGFTTLTQVLNSVPECFTSSDRVYDVAGIRGFARDGDFNTRVLILLDGHVLNEPWNNYVPIGTDLPIDFEHVERVEIIVGPVSAIYGSNAFFGAVNIVTRKSTRTTPSGSVRVGSGGLDRATAAFDSPGFSVWATATSAGGEPIYFPALAAQGLPANENHTDWDRNAALGFTAGNDRLNFHGGAWARRKGVIGGEYGAVFGDDRNWTEDSHGFAELSAKVVDEQALKVRLRGYADAYAFNDHFRYDPDPLFLDHATSLWSGGEAVLEWVAGPSSMVLSLEDSYSRVTEVARQVQGQGTVPPSPSSPTNLLPVDVRRDNVARVALAETLRLGSLGRIVAGAYVEDATIYGVQVAPRAGVVLHPWSNGTVKALYQRGFRSPSIYERFFQDGNSVAANPELKSEAVDGFELAISQKMKSLEIGLSGFDGEYRNLILQENVLAGPVDATRFPVFIAYRNSAGLRESGATARLDFHEKGMLLRLDGSAFLVHSDLGGDVEGVPNWLAHAVGVLPLANGHASIAARVTGIGTRTTRDGEKIGPVGVADASLRVNRVWRDLAMVAGVTNIFDSSYGNPVDSEYVPPTIPQPGRRFFLEARWGF